MIRRPPRSPLFPYTTLSRSRVEPKAGELLYEPLVVFGDGGERGLYRLFAHLLRAGAYAAPEQGGYVGTLGTIAGAFGDRAPQRGGEAGDGARVARDRKSTRLNSSHANISYAVFCL